MKNLKKLLLLLFVLGTVSCQDEDLILIKKECGGIQSFELDREYEAFTLGTPVTVKLTSSPSDCNIRGNYNILIELLACECPTVLSQIKRENIEIHGSEQITFIIDRSNVKRARITATNVDTGDKSSEMLRSRQ